MGGIATSFVAKIIACIGSIVPAVMKSLSEQCFNKREAACNLKKKVMVHSCGLLLTNQFTSAWTHYTDTTQGTRTDHTVGYFQKDIDRISSLFY